MRKLLILAGIAGWHLSTFAYAGNIVETAHRTRRAPSVDGEEEPLLRPGMQDAWEW